MTLTEALANEVRAAAEDQDLTISELSHQAGIHRVTMQRYLVATRSIPSRPSTGSPTPSTYAEASSSHEPSSTAAHWIHNYA